ncbi:hypothetical protein QQF64_008152 [Cirrhinus molitorella]|uniref:Uncharacterized protein n=1 Tax=Cirrhinus molitorella TaxID=172907 RepID=A0ABR3M660_9TELE
MLLKFPHGCNRSLQWLDNSRAVSRCRRRRGKLHVLLQSFFLFRNNLKVLWDTSEFFLRQWQGRRLIKMEKKTPELTSCLQMSTFEKAS